MGEMYFMEELQYRNRCLRTFTGKLLFGPSGRRLAVDCLDCLPGFVGAVDFIHKMNVTELFRVMPDISVDFSQADCVWYPNRLTMEYRCEDLDFRETKTIVEDDAALSLMEWRNNSAEPFTIEFLSNPECFISQNFWKEDEVCWGIETESPETRFGFSMGIVCGWNQSSSKLAIKPGESVKILAVAAVGNMEQETFASLRDKVKKWLSDNRDPDEIMAEAIRSINLFYERTPSFVCDDKRMNACWQYRWYILKNTLVHPGYGKFSGAVMYEGRDHRMQKTALTASGWEFSKLIPLSTPLQLTDFRWFRDHGTVKEVIRSAFAAQDENGLLLCSYVEDYGHEGKAQHGGKRLNGGKAVGVNGKSYANYILWAIWNDYLLNPDRAFIQEMLPSMKAYISGHEKVYMDGRDSLLIEYTHALTGKEYQPSYWYFYDYPPNPRDRAGFTPLKRVDRSVYHYLNLCGLSNLMDAVGEDGSGEYREKARQLKQEINEWMWDKKTDFYYDLHFETKEKAMVKNIVGIYPYWAGIAGAEREEGIEKLRDRELFDTGSAFPSVAEDCPAFSPEGGWMGNYIKGRNGCVWCGPSWPYTTGIALDALGKESLRREHRFDKDFDRFLTEYTIQHFRDGDRHRPYLVEHYNSVTGERLSDEADYNHSYWLDLIITYVAGVQVFADHVRVEPLRTHLKWFRLDGLSIRGHLVSVLYAEGMDRDGGKIPKGLTVLADGKKAAHREESGVLIIEI